jgi:hypothetical protein
MATPETMVDLQFHLPPGRWTMVLSLADVAYIPLNPMVKEFLDGFAATNTAESVTHRTAAVLDPDDGKIYYRYDTKHVAQGEAMVAEVIPPLLRGIRALDLNLIIQGKIDHTNEISPDRPLSETFPYMREADITSTIEDMRSDPFAVAFEDDAFEWDHLLDH